MNHNDSSSSPKATYTTPANLYTPPHNLSSTHNPVQTSHSMIGSASSPLGAAQIGSLAIWLAVIIGLILIASYLYKRFIGYRDQSSNAIRIVASRALGQRERIVVADVAGKRLVLGVTSQSITRLHSTPQSTGESDAGPATTTNQPPSFAQALATNLRLTKTRSNRERNGQ